MIAGLSIVVPAYNEEATIAATVTEAFAVGVTVARTVEVVVCDDGSHDQTRAILERIASDESRLKVVARSKNRGIEASIRTLYAVAAHDWVFLNSADRQWPMTALVPMAAAVAAGADLVIGVRRNKRDIYSPYRQVLSWTYEAVVRRLGAPGGDPGSIKLGRRRLLHAPVVARGVFAEGERVVRAARAGAKVVEVAVPFARRGTGQATGARRDVVAQAAIDVGLVAASLYTGWPRPTLPDPLL